MEETSEQRLVEECASTLVLRKCLFNMADLQCPGTTFARPREHPQALFSLVPNNGLARSVLLRPENRPLVSAIPEANVRCFGIEVGPHVRSLPRDHSNVTLATVGREGDIKIPHDRVSRCQIAFETKQGSIMLHDCSTNGSTQTLGDDAYHFQPGRKSVFGQSAALTSSL